MYIMSSIILTLGVVDRFTREITRKRFSFLRVLWFGIELFSFAYLMRYHVV